MYKKGILSFCYRTEIFYCCGTHRKMISENDENVNNENVNKRKNQEKEHTKTTKKSKKDLHPFIKKLTPSEIKRLYELTKNEILQIQVRKKKMYFFLYVS